MRLQPFQRKIYSEVSHAKFNITLSSLQTIIIYVRFANKKSFIFVFGVVGLIFASSHAYYNGTITTMEKRFKIPSKNMGFIATGNDITGFMLSSFIAYYGGRGRVAVHINR